MHILLADRQPKVRFALRALLRRQTGIEVVGEAGTVQEVLAQARLIRPEVVLLDWSLWNGRTRDLVHTLRTTCPDLYVIALDVRPEMRSMALAAGANGFVSKADSPDCLLSAIQRARQPGEEEG
jgi:DNA-binding NarL/FixJ family response regulator